jgi:hypothetical protein
MRFKKLVLSTAVSIIFGTAGSTIADDGPDHDELLDGSETVSRPSDLSAPLIAHDAATAEIVSSGPTAKVIKNLDAVGRGERNVADATTDVWAHNGYAYTGTFNSPCGGDP